MAQFTMSPAGRQYSAAASLAAMGMVLQRENLFGPIRERVKIAQKTIKDGPLDKLQDAFITILAGGRGLVAVNSVLRPDVALQRAVGRQRCAEQSVVQDTLDACSEENVAQLAEALAVLFRRHSQSCRHDYAASWLVVDVDLSGLPCGEKAALATKGYFPKQRGKRGRQLGRVLVRAYQEVVVDQLFPGSTNLASAFRPLMQAAEQVLGASDAQRARTILCVDAGGGTVEDLNWALAHGYQLHAKDFTSARVRRLAGSITQWYDDPKVAGRQVAQVEGETDLYLRPLVRIAVRRRRRNGQWAEGIILSSLTAAQVLALSGGPPEPLASPQERLLAYVYFYDQRGGGVETALKSDKQGLGLTKRNKKRLAAQEMVMLLGQLAHNVLLWCRHWLASEPKLASLGVQRLVRDLFHIAGFLALSELGGQVVLNQAAQLASELVAALRPLLLPLHVDISLGQI